MATYELDTKTYTDFVAALARCRDLMDRGVDNDFAFSVLNSLAARYFEAHDSAEAEWDAIPEGDAKDSAHNNADDMKAEGLFSANNHLAWYLAAVASYE
jgi:hypothetical protein